MKIQKQTKEKNSTEHKCALCSYSSKFLRYYKHHLAVHSTEKPFKCPECPFKSKWERNVKTHVKSVHVMRSKSSRPFPCPHPGCNYAGKNKYALTLHSKIHSDDKSFHCSHPNCNYSANYKQSLTAHTLLHTGEKPWVCQFESCSYATVQQYQLVRHTRTHTNEKPFKCPEPNCEYSASQLASLKRHQLNHEPNPEEGEEGPLFSCPICDYSSKRKKNLSSHIKHKHTLEKLFKCDEPNCNFEAKTPGEIKIHKLVHSDEKPFACSFESCEYRCKYKSNLSTHLKTHSEERQFKCELCPFRGKIRNTVLLHLKQVHSDIRPFPCTEPQCDFRAKTKPNLNLHMLTHRVDKKFSCSFPDCGYRAVEQYKLKRHQRNMHEPEKRLKCSLCHFAAKGKPSLVAHMRRHTKEEPFVCKEEGCGYRAKASSSLRRHQKKNMCRLGTTKVDGKK